ncbi:MAG TPA: SGNH/GDSL hydrolase family protein [Nocardioidaceae bacterium]|nr:SGNH/GDSL hydrolase family protein [Nocardioidaceae bacterium]
MSKAGAARKLAAASAFGGVGLSVVGASLYGLLRAEASMARRVIGPTSAPTPDASGAYGRQLQGPPIRLALLGDSGAVGYGMTDPDHTPGAILAAGLAEMTGRPVRLTVDAVVGAEARHLGGQIDRALDSQPDAAVIIIGANDVTHTRPPTESVRTLGTAVRRLRDAGCAVVVGTCPDLGTIRPIAPPLRQVARLWSRRLAAAQTIAVVEAGGRSVSLGALLGPEFDAAPTEFFGPDRFHPSGQGYASVAAAILPSLAASLGFCPEGEDLPETFRGEGILPVSYAAAEASRDAGTEVAPTEIGGHERGPRGRWVSLRHRRRSPLPDVERVEETADADSSRR